MRPHLEVLEAAQLSVLQRMARPMADAGFHLVGGTAIALHLGHRKSVDLDWFTGERLDDPLRLVAWLRDDGLAIDDVRTDRGTVHGAIEGVRVSLIEYRYRLLSATVRFEGIRTPVAALDDLAAMKLAAIAQRGARRDFLDVHALAREFRPLPELLEAYRRKYDAEDTIHVVYALSCFDDAEAERMPRMLVDVDWEQVKSDLRRWIKAL